MKASQIEEEKLDIVTITAKGEAKTNAKGEFYYSKPKIDKDDIAKQIEYLSSSLKKLTISYGKISNIGFKEILQKLSEFKSLKYIEFSNNEIEGDKITTKAETLQKYSNLLCFAAHIDDIEDDPKQILDLLPDLLERLSLHTSYNGIKFLADKLPKFTSLKMLNLANNNIEDLAAQELVTKLSECKHLELLCLANNSIKIDGFLSIISKLPKLESIKYLDISNNPITDKDVKTEEMSHQKLNNLDSSDLTQVIALINQQMNYAQYLHANYPFLAGNPNPNLLGNCKLQYLDLSSCSFKGHTLAKILSQLTKLEHLDLGYNGSIDVMQILKALSTVQNLRNINLEYTYVDINTLEFLNNNANNLPFNKININNSNCNINSPQATQLRKSIEAQFDTYTLTSRSDFDCPENKLIFDDSEEGITLFFHHNQYKNLEPLGDM
jgi:hypothetical protein